MQCMNVRARTDSALEGDADPPQGTECRASSTRFLPSIARLVPLVGKSLRYLPPELGNLPRTPGVDRAERTVFSSGWPGAIPVQNWPPEELPRVRASVGPGRVNMGTAFAEVVGA